MPEVLSQTGKSDEDYDYRRKMSNSEYKKKILDALAQCKEGKKIAIDAVKALLEELFNERQETENAITYLRKTIAEINLLNARILYSSKAMKGRNFTPEQKVAVIEDFDRAKTVQEVRVNTAMETSKCDLTIKEGVLNILGGEYDAFLYFGENGEEVKIMVKVEEVY